jgi:antitoxin component YwqK of YwqJK toxin-antitoxin module
MNLKIISVLAFFLICSGAYSQSDIGINKTDKNGLKQGPWIKLYPNNNTQYEGVFKDNHPVGEFKRYYENKNIQSKLIYSDDGKEVDATFYHLNGNVSSKGKFKDQLKEGKWQYFSEFTNEYLVAEETYIANIKNGVALKFYPDKTIAEKLYYRNDTAQGELIQYYPNGAVSLKTTYLNNKMNGKYEVWFQNGKLEFAGQYKNDAREGIWIIYKPDGTVKYKLEYVNGLTNDKQADVDESDLLDLLEKNKGKIPDPEKGGFKMK